METILHSKTISVLILSTILLSQNLYSQNDSIFWSTNGNASPSASYSNKLGTVDANIPLNIYAGNKQRMIIDGSIGFVGIGDVFTSPKSLLHVNGIANLTGNVFRTDGDSSKQNMWQLYTGGISGGANEKFRLSIPANSNNVEFRTMQNGTLSFCTNNKPIAIVTSAKSLSSPGINSSNGDGIRIINSNGALKGTLGNLDMWTADSGRTHIRWGTHGHIDGVHLRLEFWSTYKGFWFNADNQANLQAGFPNFENPHYWWNINKTEVARLGMSNSDGYMRIGLNPKNLDAFRRLEVYDNSNLPQFRISQFSSSNTNASVFADFQTTPNGDLTIFPVYQGKAGRIGFNTNTPGNTLEINSNLLSANTSNGVAAAQSFSGTATGNSGLRFSDLTSSSTPQENPGIGVLALNTNGDVIYVSFNTENKKYDSLLTILKNNILSLQNANTSMQNQINQLSNIINSCCKSNSNSNCESKNEEEDDYDEKSNHQDDKKNNNSKEKHKPNNKNCKLIYADNVNYNNNKINNITSVELADIKTARLTQNTPNPFSEQTIINYFLPDDIGKAQILFHNEQGRLIQSIELTQKGNGSINVFSHDLAAGIYSYSLVIDGHLAETKKMMKE